MENEKIQELEIMVENLVIQTNLLMAKQGAMTQMVLGIYRETFDKEKYNRTATQFIELLELYSLSALKNLEALPIDPLLLEATREKVCQDSSLMLKKFLS